MVKASGAEAGATSCSTQTPPKRVHFSSRVSLTLLAASKGNRAA